MDPITTLTLRAPDDWHVHLRDGPMLKAVVWHTIKQFRRALVMPNLTPPVLTADDVHAYRAEIQDATFPTFEPLMTIKITDRTTPEIVRAAREAGAVAGKLYPEGVTTNSEDGVRSFWDLRPVFCAMRDCGMILSLHAETPGVFVMDREANFLHQYVSPLAVSLPGLRIVVEHATSAAAVRLVDEHPNVGCTITPHHLYLTLDDVVGGALNPHAFCKPIAKTHRDRDELVKAAISGHPRIFLGTDSAPHVIVKKECASGCAGVFCAPVALETVAEVFDRHSVLHRMEHFVAEAGAKFYGLPLNTGQITLRRETWRVPEDLQGVRPFMAGKELAWKSRSL